MVWRDYIRRQFDNVDRATTNENEFYAAFNSLLFSLFPPEEDYDICPQFNAVAGVIDFAVTHNAIRPIPIFFIEIKVPSNLDHIAARALADGQMRQRFTAIRDAFTPIPLPALIGISAMGTRFSVYRYGTDTGHVAPPEIMPSGIFVTDTAPQGRWRYELMRRTGEHQLRLVVDEVKQMVLTIQHQQGHNG
jgi:hypothetical protein